jgi:hypothetical protein
MEIIRGLRRKRFIIFLTRWIECIIDIIISGGAPVSHIGEKGDIIEMDRSIEKVSGDFTNYRIVILQ